MSVTLEPFSRNICRILINRPAKRNALNLEAIKCLRQRFEEFERDDNLRIAILSGVGGHFCAGYDLNDIINPHDATPNMDNIQQMLWPLGTRLSTNKLVIASIEGFASGFGYELALKCDIRVCEKDARMGFMNRRFGIPIMNGGTVILPKLIGISHTADLILTGKAQLTPEAVQCGLVASAAEIGCGLGKAITYARSLIKFNQDCLINDYKRLTSMYEDENTLSSLASERDHALGYLKNCGSLDLVAKFLKGELCRHGNYDLGNLPKSEPQVTL